MAKRRSRTRKQRAGGLFNRVRSFFTRRQAPVQPTLPNLEAARQYYAAPNVRNLAAANTRPAWWQRFTRRQPVRITPAPVASPERRHEDLKEFYMRMFAFFYRQHFGADSLPADQLKLTEAEYIRLVRAFKEYMRGLRERIEAGEVSEDDEYEIIAQEFLNIEGEEGKRAEEVLQGLLKDEEKGPDRTGILFAGTSNEKRTHSIGAQLSRYFKTLQKFPRYIDFQNNAEKSSASLNTSHNTLKTLNSDRPIYIYGNKEVMERQIRSNENARKQKETKNNIFITTYIVLLRPEFFPHSEYSSFLIKARNFSKASFIQDAFRLEGVLAMDPDLLALLMREAPELLKLGEVKLYTQLALRDLSLLSGKFIVFEGIAGGVQLPFDPDVMSELRAKKLPLDRTYMYPAGVPLIRAAMEAKKVLLLDPLTAYVIRKYDPDLWLKMFNDTNMEKYSQLSEIEKFVLTYLQHQEIMRRLKAGSSLEEAVAVYSEPITETGLSLENYGNTGANSWTNLKKFRNQIENRSVNIEDKENLRQLFGKFLNLTLVEQSEPDLEPEEAIRQINSNLGRISQYFTTRRLSNTNRASLTQRTRNLLNRKRNLQRKLYERNLKSINRTRRMPRVIGAFEREEERRQRETATSAGTQ